MSLSLSANSSAPAKSQAQMDLDNNSTLQAVLKQRRMLMDSLRSAMVIQAGSKGGGGKGVPGAICFAWGAGSNGQLGQPVVNGQLRSVNTPTVVKFDKLENSIVRVASGNGHVSCVTDAGEVYGWGDGRSGQLGYIMERSNNQPTPMIVDTLVKQAKGGVVKTIACGQSHSLAIDVEGTMHAWGAGKNGQLGTSRNVPYEPIPKMVSFKYSLDQVACGDQHSAAIDDRGRVFTWGLGDAGQLGHGFDKPPAGYPLAEPYQVVGLPQHLGRMVQISCGSQFTAVVSQRGEVYVWGFGEYLYSTIEENFAYEPEKIQLPKKVLEVGCGRGHIVARTEDGNVYTWGSCDSGQLGHGRKFPTSTPRLVLEGKQIVEVAAGRYHTTALNIYGVLYTWGCGESGQLGHGDDENCLLPKVNESLLRTVVGQTSCGEHHTAAVCSARLQEVDAQMKKWLDNEKEEYELKQDAAETCPVGLGPKELSALVTERDALRLAKSLREEKKEMKLEREVKGEFEEVPDQEGIRQSILQGIEARGGADRPDSRGSNLTGVSEESAAQERLPDVHVKKGKKKKRRGGGQSAMAEMGESGFGDEDDESGLRFDSSIFTAGFEDIGDETAPSGGRMDDTFFDMMHQATKKGSKWMSEQDRRGSSLVRSASNLRSTFRKDGTELMKEVKQTISVGDMDMDQWEMEKAYQTLLDLKETYDLTRNGANAKEDQLMAMLTELRALEASTQSFDGYVAEQAMKVKMLRQAFSTVKLNWQEALENKHNYEDILSQLKYEGRMQQMELNRVKRLNQDQTKHVMKATKLKDNAEIQEELAHVERDEFEKDVHKTKVTFEAYEHHFKTLGQTIQLSRERAEQYAIARQRKNADFSSKAEKKMRKKYKFMEDAMREQEAKREMADETRLQLEEKYNKLINATNLNDPSDIIDKFYHMEQVHAGLKMQIETNERKTLDLETERQTLQDEHAKLDTTVSGRGRWNDIDQKRTVLTAKLKLLKEKEGKLLLKRMDQATYSQGIFALARRLEGSPLLPEGTQVPAQNLEGVMRSLDMVERALEEAMLMADAMPGPEESAIAMSPSESAMVDGNAIQEPPMSPDPDDDPEPEETAEAEGAPGADAEEAPPVEAADVPVPAPEIEPPSAEAEEGTEEQAAEDADAAAEAAAVAEAEGGAE